MKISVGRYGSNSHQIALALSPAFWQEAQAKIRADHVEDFFPYPEELRFANSRPSPADEALIQGAAQPF